MKTLTSESSTIEWVRDYYGRLLGSSSDLKTNACCAAGTPPGFIAAAARNVHDDVLARFYVIVSNCVVNLSPRKDLALQEAFRVLKPGRELYLSDVVVDRRLPPPISAPTPCSTPSASEGPSIATISRPSPAVRVSWIRE